MAGLRSRPAARWQAAALAALARLACLAFIAAGRFSA
jgi:hypothetical protein